MGDRSAARLLSDRAIPYAPQLDGLRAIAVAAVAWSHWMPAWQFGLPFGAGVHLFFVLSGYLITGILLGIADRPNLGRALAHFYARRILRLAPAFALTLGLAGWADVPEARASWRWHAAYLSNVWIVRDHDWHGALSHLWSLAVEEQFYVVWPWVVLATPAPRRTWVVVVAIACGPLTRMVGAATGLAEPFLALVPGGSADSLGLGAWLAVASHDGPWPRRRLRLLPALGLVGWLLLRGAEQVTALPVTAVALRHLWEGMVFLGVVAAAARGLTGRAGAVLAHPVLVYLGRISYGLYLAHNFAPLLVRGLLAGTGLAAMVPDDGLARLPLLVLVTVASAAASWHLVEAPINRWKRRFPY